jgi:imidazolonepropionase-like amidohydrolase
MRKFAFIITALLSIGTLYAQIKTDSGVFLIHKFQQVVGKEVFTAIKAGNVLSYDVHFNYVDRGRPVDLGAMLQLTPKLDPLFFGIKGGTSRFSAINDSVTIKQGRVYIKVDDTAYSKVLQPNSFPVSGYAPAIVQRILIEYWEKQDKPAVIRTLPFGEVHISLDGNDTFSLNKGRQVLKRFVIKGLIWGNELVWTDQHGQLICLITNDGEGDKQEIVNEAYETALPFFIEKAAFHGMRLFTKSRQPSYQSHAVIAITGGRLVDVINGIVTPNGTVLIENGKIKYAGSTKQSIIPKNAFIINAEGKTILPGLWDMHAHFQQSEWGPAYLAAGVTTVRDCGNEFSYINTIKKTIDEGIGVGPNILKAGIIDGKGPKALGIIQADTRQEAISAVQHYKENGFVQIKIYSSVKPEIVKAICEEAHRLGLTVTGHIPTGMTLRQAIDSGMDMVNHLRYVHALLKRDPKTSSINLEDSANLAVLQFLKSRGFTVDPTLGIYEMIYRSLKEDITKIEPAFATLPEPLKPLFLTTGTADSSQVAIGKNVMQSYKELVAALHKSGAPIIAGTDMMFPGLSIFRELELYVESGLTPLQALQTATIVPARVMKMEAESGSLNIDKKADIILVDGDPMQTIHNIRKVTLVIKAGRVYDPKVLRRMAEFIEQ